MTREPMTLGQCEGSGSAPPRSDSLYCTHCRRATATVGRGACSECWQVKTPDGISVLKARKPKTEPLIGSLDNIPDLLWIAIIVTLVAGGIRGLIYVFL